MEVKIIDRTEEERNKNFEEAFAEGIRMTVEEVREAREEIKRMGQRREEAKRQGMILEQCPTGTVGRVIFQDSFAKDIKKAFECENYYN